MEPFLLTPGPLTTSKRTKEAMLRDWGSRDAAFIEITKNIRSKLVALIHGGDDYTCVPIQGSGTFAVESMIGGLTNEKSKILLLINGAYGYRMKKICDYLKREYIIYETNEDKPPDVNIVEKKNTKLSRHNTYPSCALRDYIGYSQSYRRNSKTCKTKKY